MLRQRYPYASAGKIAGPAFAIVGGVAGFGLALRLSGGPSPPINAVLWGALAGAAAFIVFSSQGPQRPVSVTQAAVADGVVAGIIGTVSASVLWVLVAGRAGAGGSISWAALGAAVGGGALGGGTVGALLGWTILLVGGRARLERQPARRRSRERKPKRARQKRRRK